MSDSHPGLSKRAGVKLGKRLLLWEKARVRAVSKGLLSGRDHSRPRHERARAAVRFQWHRERP